MVYETGRSFSQGTYERGEVKCNMGLLKCVSGLNRFLRIVSKSTFFIEQSSCGFGKRTVCACVKSWLTLKKQFGNCILQIISVGRPSKRIMGYPLSHNYTHKASKVHTFSFHSTFSINYSRNLERTFTQIIQNVSYLTQTALKTDNHWMMLSSFNLSLCAPWRSMATKTDAAGE